MSSTGQTLYRRARKVMPGGTQLLSKRPEMFLPEQWPTYFKSAKGAEVVDLDGKTYLDMSYCGIGATILGFADPDVDAAVKSAIDMGSMSTLNCAEDIEAIVAAHGGRLAAIVMEPVRSSEPAPAFIRGVRALADRCGAALIFDEVTSGFRINSGGAHLAYGVDPDMAVFAKAIANGFPMAAIVGRASAMDAAQETFVSSTAWTERVGPVAALATLRKHREQNVAKHLMRIGTRVQKGWTEASTATDLPVHVSGISPLGHFAFEVPEAQEVRTLFTQMMLDRGIFATGSFYAMWT